MHRLHTRLAAVEQHRAPSDPRVIHIHGGLCDFDDSYATVGHEEIERDPGESLAAFERRTVAMAKAAGDQFVLVGGMRLNPSADGQANCP